MRKAMGAICLLALMLAFGVPDANAKRCEMKIQVKNDSGQGMNLKKLEARRSSESWETVSGAIPLTMADDDNNIYNFVKSVPGGGCKYNHQTRATFRCSNKSSP